MVHFIQHSMGGRGCLGPALFINCGKEGVRALYVEDCFIHISTASFTSVLPARTWKICGALSPGCSTTEIRLSPALRVRPEEHHRSISYTGWPISPGVQSLFLSSTIWNRLWCRGKSTSLRTLWCLVSISLSFPTWAEQKRKITVS